MRSTTRATVVAALVLGLAVPCAGSAAAAVGPSHAAAAGPSTDRANVAPKVVRKPRTAIDVRVGGTVTAVDAAAGTLTLTVQGGRDKALRATSLTATLAQDARVQRGGRAATLADVLVGDRVQVEGVRTEAGCTAVRVVAQPAGAPEPVPAPTPTPTSTAAPAPTS